MDQLAWLPIGSLAVDGSTLGLVQPHLNKHMCRTQAVVISAEVYMGKEELREKKEQGGSRSEAPTAQSWVTLVPKKP